MATNTRAVVQEMLKERNAALYVVYILAAIICACTGISQGLLQWKICT
jgi:hypothetical protein